MGATGHFIFGKTRKEILRVFQNVLVGEIVAHSFSKETYDGAHVLYLAMKHPDGNVAAVVAQYSLHRVHSDWYSYEMVERTTPEKYEPFFYRCPKRILDMLSPTDDERALAWRAKCRANVGTKYTPTRTKYVTLTASGYISRK